MSKKGKIMRTVWPTQEIKAMITTLLRGNSIPYPISGIIIDYLPAISIMKNALRLLEYDSFHPYRRDRIRYPCLHDIGSEGSEFVKLLKKLEIPYRIYGESSVSLSNLVRDYEHLFNFINRAGVVVTNVKKITVTLEGKRHSSNHVGPVTIAEIISMISRVTGDDVASFQDGIKFAIPDIIKFHAGREQEVVIPLKTGTGDKINRNGDEDSCPLLSTVL